eukprot:m.175694 g.175694  ORF g.175694 m.175694 type:complete len:1225 (+) comp16788_c0_seq1:101-3775(+)
MADTEEVPAEVPAEPVADDTAPEATEGAPEAAEEAPAAAEAAVEASKPGEDQFYAPPPDHVTGEVDDLAKLTNLNQNTLLSEIKTRYEASTIYTFVSDILIAVNPFQRFPIYGPEAMRKYYKQPRHMVPPHVYTIADACYHNLFEMNKNQCVVISGESGAGKTESAKFVVNYIIELCRPKLEDSADVNLSAVTNLEEQILQVNPLLEAFGNAQTVMNDNSSRFGKYTRLYFDKEGRAMGVEISEYLLEKSRVVEQAEGERNFHVFYYLFADEEERERLKLQEPKQFHNLGGVLWEDNAEMQEELSDALDVVGFTAEERRDLKSMLAAILYLSNTNFTAQGEHADLTDRAPLQTAAEFLGVEAADLEEVLLGLNTVTRGEHIRRLYKCDQAYDCRDALAKALYGSMFGYIVQRVNEMLSPELTQLKRAKGRPGAAQREAPAYEIGVLDIFGFENFTVNSFEQLCINVSHEQLQFFFNQHTFRLELEEYEIEGIDGASITFTDNKPLLDMFLDRPIGIFSLLDEECSFPQATDQSFVEKLNKNFVDRAGYEKPKVNKGYPAFVIRHFAATVEYNGTNMIEKNRDNLAGDIVAVMKSSTVDIVGDVFNGDILPTGQIRAVKRTPEEIRFHRGKKVETEVSGNKANRKAPSLSSQFKTSLGSLVDRMNLCYPHFIRCIKPNHNQRPNMFIDEFVLTQLGYTGVLEATRIRQEGYSWRPQFAEFVRRYKILGFPTSKLNQVKETESSAVKILQAIKLGNWKIGKTKLFLKYYHFDQLEALVAKYYKDVVRTQCAVRTHFARKRYNVLLERARMSAAERAEAERLEAEENERRRVQAYETNRMAREAAELEAKAKEEERRQRELELEAIREQAEAEDARKVAAMEREAAAAAKAERAEALAAAEEAKRLAEEKQKELDSITRAAQEARAQAEEASKEAKRQAFMRTKSRKQRQVEATDRDLKAQQAMEAQAKAAEEARLAFEQANAEARELAAKREAEMAKEKEAQESKYEEMLKRMGEQAAEAQRRAEEQERLAAEASKARAIAEEEARKAAEERRAEEARLQAEAEAEEKERQEANFRRSDFDLKARVNYLLQHKPAVLACSDVQLSAQSAKGWLVKMGQHRNNWRNRWFVIDLKELTIRYYASETSKKEKAFIPIDEITRSIIPKQSSGTFHGQKKADKQIARHPHLFTIETMSRVFYVEAPSKEAQELWVTIMNIFTDERAQAAVV